MTPHTSSKRRKSSAEPTAALREVLRLPPGPVDLTSFDAAATPGFPGKHGKRTAHALTAALTPVLSELQERLFANGRAGDADARSVLMVLQGMDTSGKGGVIRHAIGLVDPQGVHIKAFKKPTESERAHHYLWRIRQELPERGMIAIFDRSHYEDVLVARVDGLVPRDEWERRYDEVNRFEAELVASGTVVIKCFLHVSKDEQKQRLAARLADPSKYWKYNPGDVDVRAQWDDYRAAYADALERCSTDEAPWYIIPADRKWYRNWACAQLLREHLEDLHLDWPAATFDVAAEQQRVAAS